MEDFKRELKRKCDAQFSTLKARYKPKHAKKGSIESVQNNLKAFEKLTDETSKMVTKTANELMAQIDVSKEQAIKITQDLLKKYLEQIKKNSGF
jgi:hypothetical protein